MPRRTTTPELTPNQPAANDTSAMVRPRRAVKTNELTVFAEKVDGASQTPKVGHPRKNSADARPEVAPIVPVKPIGKRASTRRRPMDAAPDTVVEPLLSVRMLEGLFPEFGSQFEDSVARKIGKRIKTSRK